MSGVIEELKGNPNDLREKLRTIVPHAFGDHSSCTFHEDKENYVHQRLPHQKPLDGSELQITLEEIVDRYVDSADKLAPAASTQSNEAFNQTVGLKCPKAKHLSDSESFNFRVTTAVCQKNYGHTFQNKVFEIVGCSPFKNKSLKFRINKENKIKVK
ncbi:hypothetical protein TKK_0015348 [Trichogramma kaykai]